MSTQAPKQGGSNTTTAGSSTTQGGPTIDQGAVMSAMANGCKKCFKKSKCLCGVGGGSSSSSAGQGEEYTRDYKTSMKK